LEDDPAANLVKIDGPDALIVTDPRSVEYAGLGFRILDSRDRFY